MKKCSFCAEGIQDDAIKCKHCGEWLQKDELIKSTSEVLPDDKSSKKETENDDVTKSDSEQIDLHAEKSAKGCLYWLAILFLMSFAGVVGKQILAPLFTSDVLTPKTSISVLENKWERYNIEGLYFESPEPLTEKELTIPKELQADFESIDLEGIKNYRYESKSYSITTGWAKLSSGRKANLKGAYERVINQLAQQFGTTDEKHSKKPVTISNKDGLIFNVSYKAGKHTISVKCLLVVDSSSMWQIGVFYPKADRVGEKVAERIISSASF